MTQRMAIPAGDGLLVSASRVALCGSQSGLASYVVTECKSCCHLAAATTTACPDRAWIKEQHPFSATGSQVCKAHNFTGPRTVAAD